MNSLKLNVEKDIKIIKNSVSKFAESMGIFGSIKWKDFRFVNDIDLIIFVKEKNFRITKNIIEHLKLSYPVAISSLNGKYSPANESFSGKYYHITVLDSDSPNLDFMKISSSEILYL